MLGGMHWNEETARGRAPSVHLVEWYPSVAAMNSGIVAHPWPWGSTGQHWQHVLVLWEELIKQLTRSITPHVDVRTHVEVASLCQTKEGLTLILQEGEPLKADFIYLTIPAHASATLLKESAQEAAKLLMNIPFTSL